jgi:hypothetical protein
MPGVTKTMPNRIIVCGIYRSGTSLTTKLVHEWGAYVGKEQDLFRDEYGYLEHLALQKFNNELLDNISHVPTPINVLVEKSKNAGLRQRAEQIMATMDRESEKEGTSAWVWKDPQIPLAFPFWHELWKDVIYIIPVRHPVETIHSAGKMENLSPKDIPLSAGLTYWQFCMLSILNYTQDNPRKIFLSHEQLIKSPLQTCTQLCEFLDEQCGIAHGQADARRQAMAACIDQDKHHYRSSVELANLETATAEQRALYNFLRVKTLYPHESFNPDDFALYEGWREYLQAMAALVSSMSLQEGGS